jgi:hypothetical protein
MIALGWVPAFGCWFVRMTASASAGAHLKAIETIDIDRRLRELESKTMIPK